MSNSKHKQRWDESMALSFSINEKRGYAVKPSMSSSAWNLFWNGQRLKSKSTIESAMNGAPWVAISIAEAMHALLELVETELIQDFSLIQYSKTDWYATYRIDGNVYVTNHYPWQATAVAVCVAHAYNIDMSKYKYLHTPTFQVTS